MLLIGGVHSGVGKTTITSGIAAAFRQRGLAVQPFKCGPDYIDPSYHSLAAGRPCHNLDSWMLTPEATCQLFAHYAGGCDVAIVEGVMGLYDGGQGASAEVAKLLGAPVVLIINAASMAESAGAIALGYRQFDPAVNIAGVILNNVNSPSHLRWLKESIEGRACLPVIGYMPRRTELKVPERHLGLVPTSETGAMTEYFDRLRCQTEETIDVGRLLEVARSAPELDEVSQGSLFPMMAKGVTTIAVARDEAFSFYYQANLDMLAARGVRLAYFSPIRDEALPEGARGLYIGGGFPEVFGAQLEANRGLRQSIKEAADAGMPIYAECGGLMYLAEGIINHQGQRFEMVGLLPGDSVMQRSMQRMGYTVAEAAADSVIARCGQRLRGHLFHWSILPGPVGSCAYHIIEPCQQMEGFICGPRNNVLASYLHLHFASDPKLADRFIESCVGWK